MVNYFFCNETLVNVPLKKGSAMSWHWIKKFLKDEDGPTAVEYGVMMALIVMAVIATVKNLGTQTGNSFVNSGNAIQNAMGS